MAKTGRGDTTTTSLVETVVNGIIQGVREGRYVPGQRLIASDLAEDFATSRAPVREALHVLAGEGVVDLIPNRGARIRRLSPVQLFDFLEFSEAVLVLGIRRAMPKIHQPQNRAMIDEAFNRILKAWEAREPSQFVASLAAYHEDLNTISGNSFLDFFYRRPYIGFFNRLIADAIQGVDWDHFLFNYKEIHRAVLAGEPHAAVAAFVGHIQWVLSHIKGRDAAA